MKGKKFSRKESIRVVPLHQPKPKVRIGESSELFQGRRRRSTLGAHLVYRGGPLLTNTEVFTVFWGKDWKTGSFKTLAKNLNTFFKDILQSPLMAQMSEYSVPGYSIGNGKLIGTATITAGAPAHSITDSQIQTQLRTWIRTHKVPKPGKNTLYFIYLEAGVSVMMGGGSSCGSFCGYHEAIGAKTFYAVMPYPGCSGCLGGMPAFNALTGTSSHELCEAITDPIPGHGWYDNHFGEIGDICAWRFKTIGTYTVQLEWSNARNKCI